MSAHALAQGVAALGLDVPDGAVERLTAYLDLLEKWNRVYNLTAIRERSRMVVEHLLDSLAIVPFVRSAPLLDVGSGAGLPGIPLAIARPEWPVTLLESNHKRCAFLRQAAIELDAGNISVCCERVEEFRPSAAFSTIVSRAFSETQHFARAAAALLAPDGRMLAMKGLYPHEELAQLPPGVVLESVVALAVPGLDAQRHLVIMTKE
jgi:16S rRNA (guanine527-N7)-methyltransferase